MAVIRPLTALALLVLLTACGAEGDLLSSPTTTSTAPSTTATSAVPPSEPTCPVVTSSERTGRAQNPELSELSGLATGRLNPDLLWAHNDSGGAATVYAIGPEGSDAGSYPLDGASNRDWEDMAAWHDPETGVDWLYIGDIGDNLAQWESVFVYRVPEPMVAATKAEGHALGGVETFELTYPDGPHNAETLLVDPATGTITIVTKNRDGPGQVFVATDAVAGARSELVEIGLLDLSTTLDGVATAGDHAGAFVLIRTYLAVLAYPTTEGEWWLADPCPLDAPFEIQGEAVAAESTAAYWTAPEGNAPTITRSKFG